MNKKITIGDYPHIALLAQKDGKPISILDTETTGLGKPENIGIVDFAVITVLADGRCIHFNTLVQTQFKLPIAASRVHGIYPEDLIDAPTFDTIADPIRQIFTHRIVAGFNSYNYDAPILRARVDECGSDRCPVGEHLDVRLLYTNGDWSKSGKLVQVAEEFCVKVENAHRAMGDVVMTASVLECMLAKNGLEWAMGYIKRPSERKRVKSPLDNAKQLDSKPQKTKKQQVMDALIEILAEMPHPVQEQDYEAICQSLAQRELEVRLNSISFHLCDLIEVDAVSLDYLRNTDDNQRILEYLPQVLQDVIHENPAGETIKKRPILEKLHSMGVETDYVQLRIAMKDYAAQPDQKTSNSHRVRLS